MTTRPELATDATWARGVGAVLLFVVLAGVFLTAELGPVEGFEAFGDAAILESIGFALLNLETAVPTEGFLVALILVAVVLDAAMDGALMLAKRDDEQRQGGEP